MGQGDVTVFNWTYSLDFLRLPRTHNKLLRSNAQLILHSFLYLTTQSSSFRFNENIWHNCLTNIELSFLIPLVIEKTRRVNEPCLTFEVLEHFQFEASFECFVFMALNVIGWGYNTGSILTPFLTSCNISPILSRNFYGLQILIFLYDNACWTV